MISEIDLKDMTPNYVTITPTQHIINCRDCRNCHDANMTLSGDYILTYCNLTGATLVNNLEQYVAIPSDCPLRA
jgi:hypothetical protein